MSDEVKLKSILKLIFSYGDLSGENRKQWLINQILETILDGDEYNQFIAEYCDGEDGPNTYYWDKGIAP